MDYPNEGEGVQDNVPIRATVKTAPGISVRGVQWQAHGERYYEGRMSYAANTGVAEAIWETWRGPNGGYRIYVRATGYQVGVQGPDYFAEAWTNVYVNNPPIHVTSWVWSDDHYELIDGIEVYYWQKDKEGKYSTPFDLDRQHGKLEASGEWRTGDGRVVQFERWVISGGDPNMGWVWEQGGTGIGIDDWMLEMLYGRQLQCLYVPKQ